MWSGAEELSIAATRGNPKAQHNGFFLRPDDEETGEQEQDDQADHDNLDDGEAALERVGERLRSRVLSAFERRRRGLCGAMIMIMLVMRMVVRIAHGSITFSLRRSAP